MMRDVAVPAFIGVSGRMSAGKSTVALLLEAAGTRTLIAGRPDRTRQSLSACLEARGGREEVVLDGLYSLEDKQYVEQRFQGSSIFIHVEAPREVRMLRRLGWTGFDADFYREDDRIGVMIDQLKPGATFRVHNGGSEAALARQIRKIAKQIDQGSAHDAGFTMVRTIDP